MITVISATNRPQSMSRVVAGAYLHELRLLSAECQLFDLQTLPTDFAGPALYGTQSEDMRQLIAQYIEHSDKIVFVVPEYQGSFPGVLKAFLDGVSPRLFKNKKTAIVGVSDGRAGNLRGQEHLTGVLHYLKAHVHYNKPKLSQVNTAIDKDGQWLNEAMHKMVQEHAYDVVHY